MIIHRFRMLYSRFARAALVAALMAAGRSTAQNSAAPSVPRVSVAASNAASDLPWPDAGEVRARMQEAFRPELAAAQAEAAEKPKVAKQWQAAVFYAGVSAAWQATGDQDYHDALLRWGESVKWEPGPRPRPADDVACGQAFIEIFQREGGPERIAAVRARVDAFLASPKPGHTDWSWCDSLFMAPPVFAKLSAATGDAHYREALHPLFWDAISALWDEPNHLFYRDGRFIGKSPLVFW